MSSLKEKQIIIDESNYTEGVNTNSKLSFKLDNSSVMLKSIMINYSWFNVSSQLKNNKFSYTWYGLTNEVILPDGHYTISDINDKLHEKMEFMGHYFIDKSGNHHYMMNIYYDPKTFTINIERTDYIYDLGWRTLTNNNPQRCNNHYWITIPDNMLGFEKGNYPESPSSFLEVQTNIFLSVKIPKLLTITKYFKFNPFDYERVKYICLKINNQIVYKFWIEDEEFGDNIVRYPNQILDLTSSDDNYSLEITDQDGIPLQLNVKRIRIELSSVNQQLIIKN